MAAGDAIAVAGPRPRFVGRGGEKLAAALERFGLEVRGRRAVDAGSSTGGFTDCLLQAGAARVVAIDVGRHQLHERLRADSRVESREQTDIRTVEPGSIGGTVPILVADLSFISLRSVVDALLRLCDPHGDLVLLVKPQFEAGRREVGRGQGIITDPAIHERVQLEIDACLVASGLEVMGWCDSPITGAEGNREFLVHAHRPTQPGEAR